MKKNTPTLKDFNVASPYDMDYEIFPEKEVNELLKDYGVQIYLDYFDAWITPVIIPVGFKKPTKSQINKKLDEYGGKG